MMSAGRCRIAAAAAMILLSHTYSRAASYSAGARELAITGHARATADLQTFLLLTTRYSQVDNIRLGGFIRSHDYFITTLPRCLLKASSALRIFCIDDQPNSPPPSLPA